MKQKAHIVFLLLSIFAATSLGLAAQTGGTYADGYTDGAAAVVQDMKSVKFSEVFASVQSVAVPAWRLTAIRSQSAAYQQGFVAGYNDNYSSAVWQSRGYRRQLALYTLLTFVIGGALLIGFWMVL